MYVLLSVPRLSIEMGMHIACKIDVAEINIAYSCSDVQCHVGMSSAV